MTTRRRIHLPRNQTAEQQVREAAIRDELHRKKPSLEQLLASGNYTFPVEHGEFLLLKNAVAETKKFRIKKNSSRRSK